PPPPPPPHFFFTSLRRKKMCIRDRTWVEQNLAEAGQTIEHMVQMDAQQQAADQVSIGNSIGSPVSYTHLTLPTS
ncbi:hypothetical protein QN398_26920, partial [Pseudomonas sp. CCC2.2]|nr:hypothetical protein [Pseudomonas sp. CCC2.2]